MKASEALSLGRTITDNPKAGDINSCALGMMLTAMGMPLVDEPIDYGNARVTAVQKIYPWMAELVPDSFVHLYDMPTWYGGHNWHSFIAIAFNQNVMDRQTMTLDQLHDIIAEVEPACGICNKFDCSCHEVDTAVQSLVQERSGHVEEAFKNMEMAK